MSYRNMFYTCIEAYQSRQYMSDFEIDNMTMLAPNSYLFINNEFMLPIIARSNFHWRNFLPILNTVV